MREISDDGSDDPTRTQRLDTPPVLVLPGLAQRGAALMVFVTVVMLAMVVIGPSDRTMTFLGLAASAGAIASQMLAAGRPEVRLEFDSRRVVVRYGIALLGRTDVAFPVNRFGSVRTSLAKGRKGGLDYTLELLTLDRTHAVQLAGGAGGPAKRGMTAATGEPGRIAELRQTVSRRLGVVDEGCVGLTPALPTLSRSDGAPA